MLRDTMVSDVASYDILNVRALFVAYGIRFKFDDDNVALMPNGDTARITHTRTTLPQIKVRRIDGAQRDSAITMVNEL